jgi:hypothetical protein
MANLTLTFEQPLNVSISVGDTAYYASTSSSGGFNVAGTTYEIGLITSVDHKLKTIIVDTQLASGVVTTSDFIFFSKNNTASMSSVLGYYAEVKMTNTDQDVPANVSKQVELFQVGMDVFESSK